LTKLDCVFPECKGAKSYEKLPSEAKQFVRKIEEETGAEVVLIGTGPDALDMVDRRK
jgi:adenylosuccinate synthase